MLSGGALRPWERRRAVREDGGQGEEADDHDEHDPARDRGHVAADEVVDRRCSEIVITPPTAPLSTSKT